MLVFIQSSLCGVWCCCALSFWAAIVYDLLFDPEQILISLSSPGNAVSVHYLSARHLEQTKQTDPS